MNSYSRFKEMLQFFTYIIPIDVIPHHRHTQIIKDSAIANHSITHHLD